MKRIVDGIDATSPAGQTALQALSRLPSGWTALVALSSGVQKTNKRKAIVFAERAVEKNSGVWQGHVRRVRALERANRHDEATAARLAGVLMMTPASLTQAAGRWFKGQGIASTDWEKAALACGNASFEEVTRDVVRYAEQRWRLQALERLASLGGASAIARFPDIDKKLPESEAIALARTLRISGHVTAPLTLLRNYPPSDAISKARVGVEQDQAALNRVFKVSYPTLERYSPEPKTSLYLLHNSLPYSSGGYANRTHGLISAMLELDTKVVPVTRPGFPAKQYVFDQMEGVASADVVGSVRYHRILGKVPRQPRSDVGGFIDDYVRALEPFFDRYRPAVIHGASSWWNGFAAVSAASGLGVPSIYEIRGLWEVTKASRVPGWADTDRYAADSNYETEAAARADRVIVITNALREEMIRRGIDGSKILVVPNAVDVARFSTNSDDEAREALANRLGIGEDLVIGFAGSLTFYEGLDDLLRAGALLRSQVSRPFRFLFVGDGPVSEDLEALAGELGIADICHFTGRVPPAEVAGYLSLMSITPFPRKPLPVCEMVSPLKPLESMASGAVVLASDVQALAEMVPDGTGFLFEKGNVEDLAERLGLLIDDGHLRQELADNARIWVEENRTWAKVGADVVAMYDELELRP